MPTQISPYQFCSYLLVIVLYSSEKAVEVGELDIVQLNVSLSGSATVTVKMLDPPAALSCTVVEAGRLVMSGAAFATTLTVSVPCDVP